MASHQHTNTLFIRPSFLSPNRYIANFKTRIIDDLSQSTPVKYLLCSSPHSSSSHSPFERAVRASR
ncbi:hypothetical protein FIBSPDRAFT_860359 [Athelia psychrophila]|uniref:Uncharacterized protein n=1 Tax=Athelia psychrophila TaxID=1759441 RepID=A0A166KBN1_9AGAM|nr:hypothetical protein FIBSPDRAFT_860359 [Fibularhizoctonia sp. CBS 109695]